MDRLDFFSSGSAIVCLLFLIATSGHTQSPQQDRAPLELDPVEVVGVTPVHGVGLPADSVPYNVQSTGSEDLQKAHTLDVSDYMNRNLGGVHANDAQNNPLQPDVQYRGYSVSPLLGLPQGLAVYQNGVRVNEPFGDVVNWELLPESNIASMNLVGGANPVYGLNTLGGAISIRTRTGFSHPGRRVNLFHGSFDRTKGHVQLGENNGTFGYFVNVDGFDEDGWRDFSPSEATNAYASLGYRGDDTRLDLFFNAGDSELFGNGPAPVELLERDRDAVFTHPDITENDLEMWTLTGEHEWTDDVHLSGNLFFRPSDASAFNGDGTEFEECQGTSAETGGLSSPGDVLCEQAGTSEEELVEDQNGDSVGEQFNAINNQSRTDQESYGGTFQTTFTDDWMGHANQFIAGINARESESEFRSRVEIAQLTATRGTTRTGRFIPGEATSVDAEKTDLGLFFTNTFTYSPKLSLTVSGRYNRTDITIRDQTGNQPDLNGDHSFDEFNPSAGFTYQWNDRLNLYGSYSESNRAPTSVELTCADEDAPCNLPNAFLADPPLELVVARSWEAGARGRLDNGIRWHLGLFHTTNENDIFFQTTGGVSSNEGFFDNIGETRRMGVEARLRGEWRSLNWSVNYSLVEPTFEDSFVVNSANHPGASPAGKIPVESGDRIPTIPRHTLKVTTEYAPTPQYAVRANLLYNSDQYLRGDPANLLQTVDGFHVVNLNAEYQLAQQFQLYGRVVNLFDNEYETFGLLGEPGEVLSGFTDPRFLGPGTPRALFVGVRGQF